MNGGTNDISGVAEADFEPPGNISVVKKKEHRVIEVAVEEGVQTVRIELC